jgi:hypothetical protein
MEGVCLRRLTVMNVAHLSMAASMNNITASEIGQFLQFEHEWKAKPRNFEGYR